jgi:hypothetical protein
MATFTMTTFNTALQNKLNTANVSLSAQDYLLLTKALKDAIEISDAVDTLAVKGVANGVASLDANVQVPAAQLLNALPSQASNANKVLTTNGSTASWTDSPTFASLSPTTIFVGTGASAFNTSAGLTSAPAVVNMTSANDSFGQLAVHNASSSSSTDIIAYANNGVDGAGWIDMGITGAHLTLLPTALLVHMMATSLCLHQQVHQVRVTWLSQQAIMEQITRLFLPLAVTNLEQHRWRLPLM